MAAQMCSISSMRCAPTKLRSEGDEIPTDLPPSQIYCGDGVVIEKEALVKLDFMPKLQSRVNALAELYWPQKVHTYSLTTLMGDNRANPDKSHYPTTVVSRTALEGMANILNALRSEYEEKITITSLKSKLKHTFQYARERFTAKTGKVAGSESVRSKKETESTSKKSKQAEGKIKRSSSKQERERAGFMENQVDESNDASEVVDEGNSSEDEKDERTNNYSSGAESLETPREDKRSKGRKRKSEEAEKSLDSSGKSPDKSASVETYSEQVKRRREENLRILKQLKLL